ncbi:efflux RND transporter periplasmic adaptor subunit [Flavobacterium enshiense]|uniref:efflux RND transporter periplasmic adaptor subunit n=1 Tax=Flavobacterium enshiense TaxID=1341165 RepID=UPI00345D613E
MRLKAIVSVGVILLLTACKNDSSAIQPTVGSITQSVYASGIVKADGQYIVYPSASGVLQKISVTVGDTIESGQSLFEIDSDKAQLTTESARLAYQLSNENNRYVQDKIAELQLAVENAKDKLKLDESIYNRNVKVKDQGGISEVDFERVELTYKSSKLAYETAQKRLNQFRIQSKNEQSRSNVNLRLSEKSQSDFTVKSAFSGQLFDILVEEGALVSPQTPMAVIGKANSFLLELEVDENDMVQVTIGQKVLVTMNSYKNQVFEAKVQKIYPIMDERSRTFKIEAYFIKTPSKLYPNLTAEANIIIREKKQAITIPKDYLIDKEYVLVNRNEKRKVKTGLSDYQKVEIVEGLKKDETIYLKE